MLLLMIHGTINQQTSHHVNSFLQLFQDDNPVSDDEEDSITSSSKANTLIPESQPKSDVRSDRSNQSIKNKMTIEDYYPSATIPSKR